MATLVCSAFVLPTSLLAQDLQQAYGICLGKDGFATTAEQLEATGYRPVADLPDLWVLGQTGHIAMSQSEFGSPDDTSVVRADFESFFASAEAGRLFRTDIKVLVFVSQDGSVAINLSEVDGNIGCSAAIARGGVVPSPFPGPAEKWQGIAGSYAHTPYSSSSSLSISLSTFAETWDSWVNGTSFPAAFVSLSR